IPFQRAPKGAARVGVQFEIDANGILHVLARDIKTGNQQVLEVKSAVDVNDAAVQKMIEESVEHAFDDLRSRRWIETKLRAQETAAMARQGLADCAEDISAQDRSRTESALTGVDQALATEDAGTLTGDLERLKSA